MEYSNKCFIGCVEAYTSGDYVYFDNIKDNPKRHHIGFILNQKHDMYIKSPSKITEETFVLLQILFGKKILKPWMNANIPIVS